MGISGAYLEVEHLGSEDVIVDDLDIEAGDVLGNDLEHLGKLGPANAVGAVDLQLALDLSAPQGADKGVRELLVVAGLARLAVRLGSALGVDAARQVVELRSGVDLVVGVLDAGGVEGGVTTPLARTCLPAIGHERGGQACPP